MGRSGEKAGTAGKGNVWVALAAGWSLHPIRRAAQGHLECSSQGKVDQSCSSRSLVRWQGRG